MSWNIPLTHAPLDPALIRKCILVWRNRALVPLCETLSPEDLAIWLDTALDAAGSIVSKHGGHVFTWDTDALDVVFDEPGRAARAALALIELNAEIPHPSSSGRPSFFEVGIHQGEFIQAGFGPQNLRRPMLFGEALDFGRRLCQLNRRYGTEVLISGAACKGLDEFWNTRVVDEIPMKGTSTLETILELT